MKNRNKTHKVAARILAGMLAASFVLAIVSITSTVPVMAGAYVCDHSCGQHIYYMNTFPCVWERYLGWYQKYCNIDPTYCQCTSSVCDDHLDGFEWHCDW